MTRNKLIPYTYETRVRGNLGYSYAVSSLNYLASSINGESARLFLVPTFVITACTVVEAALNDCIIDHFQHHLGDDHQKLARPFLYLNYRERLSVTIPTISDYRYVLDEKHERTKALFAMFELRGRLIHVKHRYRPATVTKHKRGYITLSETEADPNDPYDGEYLKPLKRIRTGELHRLTVFWRRYLYRLDYRIRRKNFNPQGMLKRATKGS